jgi:hypothetical protein
MNGHEGVWKVRAIELFASYWLGGVGHTVEGLQGVAAWWRYGLHKMAQHCNE